MGIGRSEQEIREVGSGTGTGSRPDNDKQALTNSLYIGKKSVLIMVTGNPNTLGSFGELPEDDNRCKWYIIVRHNNQTIPGIDAELNPDYDDDGNLTWEITLMNDTEYLDEEELEYERIMDCLKKAGAILEDYEFESWYENPRYD